MFIVENDYLHLQVDPNMVKVLSATLLRPGKTLSCTVCSQKATGSVTPKCTFSATFACRSISSIYRDPTLAHLKLWSTSFEISLTSLMRNGFWMSRRSCDPILKWSSQTFYWTSQPSCLWWQHTHSESVPAILGNSHTLFEYLPWTFSSFLWKDWLPSNHKLNCSCLAAFNWFHQSVIWCAPKKQGTCYSHLGIKVKKVLLSQKKAAISFQMDQKHHKVFCVCLNIS